MSTILFVSAIFGVPISILSYLPLLKLYVINKDKAKEIISNHDQNEINPKYPDNNDIIDIESLPTTMNAIDNKKSSNDPNVTFIFMLALITTTLLYCAHNIIFSKYTITTTNRSICRYISISRHNLWIITRYLFHICILNIVDSIFTETVSIKLSSKAYKIIMLWIHVFAVINMIITVLSTHDSECYLKPIPIFLGFVRIRTSMDVLDCIITINLFWMLSYRLYAFVCLIFFSNLFRMMMD